eukprot:contig_11549_g2756
MRFRDPAAKFSGNLGESWSEYIAEYQQVARDYELTASQKLQYLHNLLRGDAKRFFLDRVHGTAATFAQAVDMVGAEYNSIVRQDRFKNYLSSLRLGAFVKDGTDITAAQEKTSKTISKLAPQVPRSHHGESYNVEFLRNAVVGNTWATEPLSRIATHRLTFQQLYGELEAALHLHNEARLASMRDEVAQGPRTPEDKVPGILFAGQGRYVRKNKDIGKRFETSKGSGAFNPLSLMVRGGRPPRIEEDPEFLTLLETVEDFQGACVDTGAQRTVIGKPEALAHLQWAGLPRRLQKNKMPEVYRFGGSRHASVGRLTMRVPLAVDFFMELSMDVVDVNVPLLLGLDTLDKFHMYANTVLNRLVCEAYSVSVPLVRKLGHVYFVWERNVLCTMPELRKLHRDFFHPQPSRLYAVINKAGGDHAKPSTLKQLQQVSSSCDLCQRLAKEPSRFRVALPSEDIVFNRTVLLDIMYLDGKPPLHMVDKDTLFTAAEFLFSGEPTEDVWRAYVRCWVTPYVGYSDSMNTDQGPQLASDEWKALQQSAGIKRLESGIESHNSLGVGERHHSFLRRIYWRGRASHPVLPTEDALAMSVWGMNQTAGPSGLVPTLLVFGVLPRMPVAPVNIPAQRDRVMAMHAARAEMAKHVTKSRLERAVRSRVPAVSDAVFPAGMSVLVYREKPVDQWVGPYDVLPTDGKQVWLNVGNSVKLFSVYKVKEYVPEQAQGTQTEGDGCATMTPDAEQVRDVVEVADDGQVALTLTESVSFGDIDALPRRTEVLVTEVPQPGDAGVSSKHIQDARRDEAVALLRRKVWARVKRKDLPNGANIMGGRFPHALKHVGTPKEKGQSPYVVQGNRDKAKPFVVHNLSTLRQRSTKIIVSTSAVLGFRIFSRDVNQSYLQSKDKLSRPVYLDPRQEVRAILGVADDEVLQVLKPLYGLCDAGDYSSATMTAHIKDDLCMSSLTGDPALYYKYGDGHADGLLGSYVDDMLLGGNENFQSLTESTLTRFESKPREWDDTEFLGVCVRTLSKPSRHFSLSQPEYVTLVHKMPLDVTYDKFISTRAAFSWLAHSRPDLCAAINRAAQVSAKTLAKRHVQELNKAIKYAKSTADLVLSYFPLDWSTLHLRVYADASLASNDDYSSQLGFIILLCDAADCCHVLAYSSKKSRRVVRSITAGEVYAFANAFDEAFFIKHDLERL